MKAKELRELTTEELLKKEDELKTELYNLRFQSAVGNLEKPSRIKEIRKTIARIKMIIAERENTKEA
jgi:large subunit ribosomal protein L29